MSWAVGATVLLAVFLSLAVIAHRAGAGTAADHAVLAWMVDHRRTWLTAVAIGVTNAGSPVAVGLLAAVAAALLWWRTGTSGPEIVVVATLAAAGAASTITKIVVAAHRPPQPIQLVLETDPSYPSGHVTGTLALAGVVAVVVGRGRGRAARRCLGAATAVVAGVVALTRLYLGVHWLTDVIGGFALGGAAVVIGSSVFAWITSPHDFDDVADDTGTPAAAPTTSA